VFVFARVVTYATLFVGLVLILVPRWILEASGIARPVRLGPLEYVGIAVGVVGGALALWSILAFAVVGEGTPAPFDPPRKLVVRGPYRYVRNPMYIGAALALCGAAICYRSIPLLCFVGLFLIVTHLFVVWYEEPTLARLFADEYQAYRAKVRRWLPGRS
jgi:protein-S-isoprenylcysteine O-methyltransferase Ste14